MENEKKTFDTPDPYFASVLTITLRQEPEYVSRNKKIIFRYIASDDLYKTMNLYVSGTLQLKAIELVETIKRIRGEMLSKRNVGDYSGR